MHVCRCVLLVKEKDIMDDNQQRDIVNSQPEEPAEALRPIVSVDAEGRLRVAPLTVRQIVQLIAALEGRTSHPL